MTVRKLFSLPELQPGWFCMHHLGRTSFLFYFHSAQRTLSVKEWVQAWRACIISPRAGVQHIFETSCSDRTVFFYPAMSIEHTHIKKKKKILVLVDHVTRVHWESAFFIYLLSLSLKCMSCWAFRIGRTSEKCLEIAACKNDAHMCTAAQYCTEEPAELRWFFIFKRSFKYCMISHATSVAC